MILLSKREHLLHYMLQGYVHLSKKDYGFFNNLQYIIKTNNRVTTNQNKLFEKLLTKYQRQLKKLGHKVEDLIGVKWEVEMVTSAQEYLSAHIQLTEGDIHIRTPFDTKFIQSFRNLNDNSFLWHKDKKVYVSPYNTYALKSAIMLVNKHFDNVTYCDETNRLLDVVKEYESLSWTPTLRKINDMYLITAINNYLYEAIKHITLNNDPKTLLELSTHGIAISDNIVQDNSLLTFASAYDAVVDLDCFDQVAEWLKLLGIEHVFTSKEVIYNKEVSNSIKVSLLKYGLTCSPLGSTDHTNAVLLKTNTMTSTATYHPKRMNKIIHLTNSRPIEVR